MISYPELTKSIPAKAVILSGISVTADSRKAIPRKVLIDRLSLKSKDDKYLSDKNSWSIGQTDIPNRTPIEVHKFSFPLMIIHGEEDKLWSVQNAYQLKKNYDMNGRQAVLEINKDVGHQFPSRNSEAFEKMIDFLSR